VPTFITGGTTDHITPWEACYRSTQILGGKVTFILSTAGHIQSLINPPTSSKRKFYTNPVTPPSAKAWLNDTEEHSGSWWPYWSDWLTEQHAEHQPSPTEYGDENHAELTPAPGTYVFE
jgi:polyhydroxyalkanoate synthase